MALNIAANNVVTVSATEYLRTAASTPAPTPMTVSMAMAQKARRRLAGAFSLMMVLTEVLSL